MLQKILTRVGGWNFGFKPTLQNRQAGRDRVENGGTVGKEQAAALTAEEMTLRELRKARQLTQVSVARQLGISQDGVSRLEQRSDLLLSTLCRTVEAMGGNLSLIATFPARPPVELSGIADSGSSD